MKTPRWIAKNTLLFRVKPVPHDHRGRITYTSLLVLAKLYYGIDVYAGVTGSKLAGLIASLKALKRWEAIDEHQKVTDEGFRMLMLHVQPKEHGKMKLKDIIKTPDGPAVVKGFPMLSNYRMGVRFVVQATGEVRDVPRYTVNRWQGEYSNEQI